MCDSIVINGGNVSIQISGPCAPADGSVTAAKINSENAGEGQVLTADGAGGAAWEAAAGGGGGGLPFLGEVGQEETNATSAEITAAYTAATGMPPSDGSVAVLINRGGPETLLFVFIGGNWNYQNIPFGQWAH